MLLLSTRHLAELFLGHTLQEPLQSAKHLLHTLLIQRVPIRFLNQSLNFNQTLAVEMVAQPVLDQLQHFGQELIAEPDILVIAHVHDAVDEARLHQLLDGDALAHDQRLVGLADAESAHEADARVALGHEAEAAERREQEGVGRRVDEVGEGDEGRGEPDRRAVERRDQDLGVRVEGVRDVEVVGDEGFEPELAVVDGGGVALGAEGYICAAMWCSC